MSKATFLVTLAAATIATASPSAQSMKGVRHLPDVAIETVEANNETGQVTLRVTVEVRQYVSEIGLMLEGDSALIPSGRMEYPSQPVADRKAVEFLVPFDVPPNDTVWVLFMVVEKKVPIQGQVFRDITRTDSTGKVHVSRELVEQRDEVLRVNVRYFVRDDNQLQVLSAPPRRERNVVRVEAPNARHIPLHPYRGEEDTIECPHDTALSTGGPTLREINPITPLRLGEKTWLEQLPLSGVSRQFFVTHGQTWFRDEGETKVHLSAGYTDYQVYVRSMRAHIDSAADDARFDVIIDVREPHDSATVQELIAEAAAFEVPGYIRATIDKSTAVKLVEKQVMFFLVVACELGKNRDTRESSATDDSATTEVTQPPGALGVDSEEIFSEGFGRRSTESSVEAQGATDSHDLAGVIRFVQADKSQHLPEGLAALTFTDIHVRVDTGVVAHQHIQLGVDAI